MRRREAISTLAALATGCLRGNEESAGNGTEDSRQNGSTKARRRMDLSMDDLSALGEPPYSIVELEDVPMTLSSVHYFGAHDYEGVLAASALVEPSTDAEPVTLRTAAFNPGDEKTDLPLGLPPPYDGVGESEKGNVLYAVPTEDHDLTEEGPDIEPGEVGTDETWHLVGEPDPDDWLPETVEIGPGEGYVGEYAVVADDGELHEDVYWFGGVGDRSELSVTAWYTDSPGPAEPSRFEGMNVPNLEILGLEQDTLWYHEADESTEVYLEPSDELVEPPATVIFRNINRGDERFQEGDWRLYKFVEGEFMDVAFQWITAEGLRQYMPGRYHTSEVRLSHGSADEEFDGVSVGHLGGGLYAYTDQVGPDDSWTAALVEVDAPSIEEENVEPPEDATVETNGDRVVVTTEAWREKSEDEREGFVATRADEAAEAEHLIPEQLYNAHEGFRYALSFFEEGVETVEVRSDHRLVDRTVDEDEERTVRYGDELYSVMRV